jgi:hypothetical protein
VFALVISFLGFDWNPKQITLGLFETTKTTWQALAINFIDFLNMHTSWKIR